VAFVECAKEVRQRVFDRSWKELLPLPVEEESPVCNFILPLKTEQNCVPRRGF
jgi:hypothetical protein